MRIYYYYCTLSDRYTLALTTVKLKLRSHWTRNVALFPSVVRSVRRRKRRGEEKIMHAHSAHYTPSEPQRLARVPFQWEKIFTAGRGRSLIVFFWL